MCLRIDREFKTDRAAKAFFKKPLIAKNKIKVFKVLCVHHLKNLQVENPVYLSPYQDTAWIPYETKTADEFGYRLIPKSDHKVLDIDLGLHAFLSIKKAKDVTYWDSARQIFEMYIPKGTPYFVGINDDIVALKLVWPKPIK